MERGIQEGRGDSRAWLACLQGWELPLTEIEVIWGGLGRKQKVVHFKEPVMSPKWQVWR